MHDNKYQFGGGVESVLPIANIGQHSDDKACFGHCEECGKRLKVSRTMPTIRYMRCSDKTCKGRGKIPRTGLLESSKDSQIVLPPAHLPD